MDLRDAKRGFALLSVPAALASCSMLPPTTIKYDTSLPRIADRMALQEKIQRVSDAWHSFNATHRDQAAFDNDRANYVAAQNDLDSSLQAEFDKALASCGAIMSAMQDKGESQERSAFWLTMSGLFAGAVLGPAATAANPVAHRAAISAFSGWAGATNYAGQALRTAGLAGDAIATTRNQLAVSFNDAVKKAVDAGLDPQARLLAIDNIRAACIGYATTVPGAQPQVPVPTPAPAPTATPAPTPEPTPAPAAGTR
jgi:hypothetical protein